MSFETRIVFLKKPRLNKPVLIEGLPGLGLVGRIAAEHMIKELKAVKFAELYSPDFPPQFDIQKDGTGKMRKLEFYYYKAKNKQQKDAIILIGDDQGLTVQSQYAISDLIIKVFKEKMKISFVFTLGGYGLNHLAKNPKVFGAVNDKKLIKKFEKQGVLFGKVGGAIVGAAGLMIGIAGLHKIPGICLMGETHGNFIDPKASKNVLKIVLKNLGVEINLKGLDKKAKETEQMIAKLQDIQKQQQAQQNPQVKPLDSGHLSYIR